MALVCKPFGDIITFTRASGATWFNAAGNLVGVDFSVTSNTIGTGSKTFTLDATAGVNRSWATGDSVLISDQSNSANNMTGTVTSYTASTQVLVVNVTSTGGSGTIASWRVSSLMPRLDYNPSTLAAQGLLIEEARTNSIRNNTMQGAAAGTPGTLPTNWSTFTPLTGLTRTVVGTGTENGITYVDIRVNGTPSAAGIYGIYFEPATQVAAASGQTWTSSSYCKLASGSLAGVTEVRNTIAENNSGGSFLAGSSVPFTPTSAALNTQRFVVTRTLNNASTAFIIPYYDVALTGAAIDITLRIGLPQLENNNISTGVASATVASGGSGYAIGDVLQIVGGTASTAARLTVATLSGSAVATVTVSTAGSYSVFPSPQPVSVTAITGTGTSATFNIVPQTQTGFATSVIPTTTTALTRSADQASVNTLSPWYNATEGTLYAQASLISSSYSQGVLVDLGAGGAFGTTEYMNWTGSVWALGPNTAPLNVTSSVTTTSTAKVAAGIKVNDSVISANGLIGLTDTSCSIASAPTALSIGKAGWSGGANYFNGWIQRITYYPRRLSNAELQAITA